MSFEHKAEQVEKICKKILIKHSYLFSGGFSEKKYFAIYSIAMEYPCNPVLIAKLLVHSDSQDVKQVKLKNG